MPRDFWPTAQPYVSPGQRPGLWKNDVEKPQRGGSKLSEQ